MKGSLTWNYEEKSLQKTQSYMRVVSLFHRGGLPSDVLLYSILMTDGLIRWIFYLCYFLFILYTFYFILFILLFLSGNSGRLTWVRLQQPQEQCYPVLQVHAGSFCVPVFHMDYRIFNVHMWSFLCVRIHTGVGTLTMSHFGLKRNSHRFFFCSWHGSNLGSLDLESDAVPIEPPHHPCTCCCTA